MTLTLILIMSLTQILTQTPAQTDIHTDRHRDKHCRLQEAVFGSPSLLPWPNAHGGLSNTLETLPTRSEILTSKYSPVTQKTRERMTRPSSA